MTDATLSNATRPAGSQESPAAAAAYVAAIAAELSGMARANGLSTLAYILEMASLEARTACDAAAGRGAKRERAEG